MASLVFKVSVTAGSLVKPDRGYSANAALAVTDMAQLVTDAGSPTQGHVNTMNTDFGAANTSINEDVVLIINTGNVTTRAQMETALQQLRFAIQGCTAFSA